jgi:pimeloyl-ACP methyl ester carboxylesterase
VLLLKVNLLLSLRPLVGSAVQAREWFFTPDTPQAVVDSCLARLQDESYPAFLETILKLPHPHRVRAPVLVLGAERDAFFTADEMRRTAHAYRTEAEIFPRIGHNMMLDDGWPLVADRIDGWIRETLAAPTDSENL